MAVSETASKPPDDEEKSCVLRKSYEWQLKQEQDIEEEPRAQTVVENATHLQDEGQKQKGYAPSNGCQGTPMAQKEARKKVGHKFTRHKRRKSREDETTEQETIENVEAVEVHNASTNVNNDVLDLGPEADPDIILKPEKLGQKSESSRKLYVEEGRRFRAIDYARNDDLVLRRREDTPLETALTLQRAFDRLATFCQGILAGMTLCQCLEPFQLPEHSAELHRVYDAVLYFLTVVCLIHALDSMDSLRRRQGIPPQVIVLVYLALLLLHLGTSRYMDGARIAQLLAKVRCSQWLNIGHCIGGLLGWGLLAFSSPKQHMLRHLQGATY